MLTKNLEHFEFKQKEKLSEGKCLGKASESGYLPVENFI